MSNDGAEMSRAVMSRAEIGFEIGSMHRKQIMRLRVFAGSCAIRTEVILLIGLKPKRVGGIRFLIPKPKKQKPSLTSNI